MFKEIERVFLGMKSKFSVFENYRTKQAFEKKLMMQYGNNAPYMYSDHREYIEKQLEILVKAKKLGSISEEDFDTLDDQATALLPKNILDAIDEDR